MNIQQQEQTLNCPSVYAAVIAAISDFTVPLSDIDGTITVAPLTYVDMVLQLMVPSVYPPLMPFLSDLPDMSCNDVLPSLQILF